MFDKLVPFQKVLVRSSENHTWNASLFSHYETCNDEITCFYASGIGWKYCIPYEGNESLLGTSDSPELKPCPACGSYDVKMHVYGSSQKAVECKKCHCRGPMVEPGSTGDDFAEATRLWNNLPRK